MQDRFLSLSEAAKHVPGNPNTSSVWRWIRKGVKARNGQRVKLDHIRIGGKIFVTADGLEDFFRRTAEADQQHFDSQTPPDVTAPVDPTNKHRRIELARKHLSNAGI